MSLRLLDPERESHAALDLVPVMDRLVSGPAAEAASFKRVLACLTQPHPPAVASLPETGCEHLRKVIQPALDLWRHCTMV